MDGGVLSWQAAAVSMLTTIQMTSAHSPRSNFLQCWPLGLATSKGARAPWIDGLAAARPQGRPPRLERLATLPSRATEQLGPAPAWYRRPCRRSHRSA